LFLVYKTNELSASHSEDLTADDPKIVSNTELAMKPDAEVESIRIIVETRK
jgi:hypothetical protein